MKIRNTLIALIVASIALMSCNKEENKVLYQSYGIAYPVEDQSYAFKVRTDQGNILIPSNTNYSLEDTTRIYSTFTLENEEDKNLDSLEVSFKFIDDILYKSISTADTSLGDDAIYVRENEIWQSDINGLLNIKFSFDGGGEIHLVNLYLDPEQALSDTLALEFRHNANADPYEKRVNGIVSFDMKLLDNYMNDKDSMFYSVKINRGSTSTYLDEWVGVYKPLE